MKEIKILLDDKEYRAVVNAQLARSKKEGKVLSAREFAKTVLLESI